MLLLTRFKDEKVCIQTPAGEITIMVMGARGWNGRQQVTLGISAPANCLILREELK